MRNSSKINTIENSLMIRTTMMMMMTTSSQKSVVVVARLVIHAAEVDAI